MGDDPGTISGWSAFFPLYRYDRQRVYGDGVLVEEEIAEGFLIHWSLIWGLMAYFVLVVRWDPEGKRARRILRGKRWRDEEGNRGRPSPA
jgi:hypothetical protein